ncbi:metallopeptidase family protein [Altererythrobacter sp. C41]|uniref:metallopeptidase family protein n=1 Tax=Altererythrobacter sp. C41 TaxID=2806021 RepID=UPI0019322B6A|nr:metallopeptidase family protein [Altererythrobacter sp. C41]MBM0168920.1 metallopeptidase family protein [Altererythrobacter sp. C41]
MDAFRQTPPTAEDMERMAQAVIDSLPEEFREPLRQVVVRIEEFATREQLDSVDIRSKWNLTGLYEGRPLGEQSSWDSGELPPVISLFRRPLVREWRETGVDFGDLVRHVVVHEAGHHFGFSDEEMHWLEDSVDDELAP